MPTMRREVRTAPAKKTPVAKTNTPTPPQRTERRVAKPPASVATSPAPQPIVPAAPQVTEQRVAAKAKVTGMPKIAKGKPAAVGISKKALERLLDTVLLLDEMGETITEEVVQVMLPHYPEHLDADKARLAIMGSRFNRAISGTNDPSLDGQRFQFAEGELVLVQPVGTTGSLLLLNSNPAAPCAAVMDAKALRTVKMTIVPTDPDEFDALITERVVFLEKNGMPVSVADVS